MKDVSRRPDKWVVLKRGLSKKCPHCGRGPLFRKWIVFLDRCPVCGLVYQPNRGDIWAFWVVTKDSIAVAIVLILFRFRVQSCRRRVALLHCAGHTADSDDAISTGAGARLDY